MQVACLCVYLGLLLLLTSCTPCQGKRDPQEGVGPAERRLVSIDILSPGRPPAPQRLPVIRRYRPPLRALPIPKRSTQGSRFALSLDVPTSILSVLIDLAKNHDMRAKAAANAELMARIGRRK